eukprot:8157068-Lingulodinium_polyedra.AAC.1
MEPVIEDTLTSFWRRGRPASDDVVQKFGAHQIAVTNRAWPRSMLTDVSVAMRATQPFDRQEGRPNTIARVIVGKLAR